MIAEYVWIDGKKQYRSKYKTIEDPSDIYLEPWNYDGSSTSQATCNESEIFLHPVYHVSNPFLPKSILVLCDTYLDYELSKPALNNHRQECKMICDEYKSINPTFGFEQEYFITSQEFYIDHFQQFQKVKEQSDYYCGVGSYSILHRSLALEHYQKCLEVGIQMSGVNAEVAPSQWEFQIGPVEGILSADQLHLSRYILERVAEKYNKNISYKPKPLKNPWNGSGLHTNFSNIFTMDKNHGLDQIIKSIIRAKFNHELDLNFYGDNSERLNGTCETSNKEVFSYGVADRKASIRIPRSVSHKNYGYLEDRRPASNADPYQIISRMIPSFCKHLIY